MAIAVRQLEGGFVNQAHAYRDGNQTSVVKTFMGDELTGISSAERLRREALSLTRQNRRGFLAPHLFGVYEQDRQITLEYIPNQFYLDTYIRKASPEEREHILRQAGAVLRQVHTPINHNIEAYVTRYKNKIQKAINTASSILSAEGIDMDLVNSQINVAISVEQVVESGITFIHRDPWLNNFLYDGLRIVSLIDWEFAGIGSPYEDFAIVDLWIEREHKNIDAFWDGYGIKPDRQTLLGFVLAKCLLQLATTNFDAYQEEKRNGGGFYTNKIAVMHDILTQIQEWRNQSNASRE